jgi:paraquat-inducible protein A
MNSPSHLIACPGCDLLLKNIEIRNGKKLFCPRCNNILGYKKVHSITKILAISISGLLVYIPAIFFPLLTLKTLGMSQSGSIFDAFLSFYHQKYYFVAVLIFITSVLFPLLKLSLLFSVALQLKIRLYSRSLPFLFRTSHHLDEWGMPDVYLIAVFVSIIKISSLATVEYNIGFFCFIFLVLMTRASVSALDPQVFWEEIEAIKVAPTREGSNDS